MALIFPSNPTLGQTYQSGSSGTFVYNGEAWDSQNSNLPVTVTSASFATTASFASTRPTPQYIFGVLQTDVTSFTTNNDITQWAISSSNGITHSSGLFSLTGGKTYHIIVNTNALTFSSVTGGYLAFEVVNSSNTSLFPYSKAVVAPYGSTLNETIQPTMQMIYQPATNTSVKVRCTGNNGTATLRSTFTSITITEIA